MVQSRAAALETISGIESQLRSLGVERLALFGSFARGSQRADSDIDLLVKFVPDRKTFDNFIAVCDLLESRLGRTVELITVESLSPFVGPHILREAQDVVRAN